MAMTSSIFVQQLLQAPIYLIWLAAIVLAAVTWRRHPRVSLLAIAGLALFFVRAGIEGASLVWMFMILEQGSFANPNLLMGIRSVISVVLGIIAWALLVAAVFAGRKGAPRAEEDLAKTGENG